MRYSFWRCLKFQRTNKTPSFPSFLLYPNPTTLSISKRQENRLTDRIQYGVFGSQTCTNKKDFAKTSKKLMTLSSVINHQPCWILGFPTVYCVLWSTCTVYIKVSQWSKTSVCYLEDDPAITESALCWPWLYHCLLFTLASSQSRRST